MALGSLEIDNLINELVDDALADLDKQKYGASGLRFPLDLERYYIKFSVIKRQRQTKPVGAGKGGGPVISLPIPSGLSTGYNAQFTTKGLGPLGDYGRGIGQAAAAGADITGALTDASLAGAQAGILNAAAVGAEQGIAQLIGAAVGGLPGALGTTAAVGAFQGAMQGAGVAANPHLAVLFEGVNHRQHQFNYKFVPRNAGESGTIAAIIYAFKEAMAPELLDSGQFFKYPDEFEITFPDTAQFFFKIGTSVLTDFQINYTPDSMSAFHQNGAPVSISIGLTFQELDIITKKKIQEGR